MIGKGEADSLLQSPPMLSINGTRHLGGNRTQGQITLETPKKIDKRKSMPKLSPIAPPPP